MERQYRVSFTPEGRCKSTSRFCLADSLEAAALQATEGIRLNPQNNGITVWELNHTGVNARDGDTLVFVFMLVNGGIFAREGTSVRRL